MITQNCALFKKSLPAIALSLAFQSPYAFAMENEQSESALSNAVLPVDCIHNILVDSNNLMNFTLPTITMNQYANDLVMGDSIDGWADIKGNTHSWLQLPANQKRISNTQNQLLDDLPFFLNTLYPIVDGNKLRIDYSLPVLNEDVSRGVSTFSLFREATSEEINSLQNIPSESVIEKESRCKVWLDKLEKLNTSNVVDSTLFPGLKLHTFTGELEPTTSCFTLKSSIMIKGLDQREYINFENKNNSKNICYIDIDGHKKKCITVSSDMSYGVNLEDNLIVKPISDLIKGESGDVFYYDSTCSIHYNEGKPGFGTIVFEINGDLNFNSDKIKLHKTLCSIAGNLTFRPRSDIGYIEEIIIRPADNTVPIYISADVEFSEHPQIVIESSNANMLQIVYRKK